jgi:hypothetical protein
MHMTRLFLNTLRKGLVGPILYTIERGDFHMPSTRPKYSTSDTF